MKRIISVSYKDDTPAFFSEEFFENVRRGFTMIGTKYGHKAVSLLPKDVYCFVFWTKNCSDHFLEHMQSLQSPFYVQWTITGYDADMEPKVPNKAEVLERFKRTSRMLGNRRVVWRYDPILISGKYTVEYHIAKFAEMAKELKGYTDRCVISFLDEYGKLQNEIRNGLLRKPTLDEVNRIAEGISKAAAENGIKVQTCAERGYNLSRFGIYEGPCVDAEFIESEFGVVLDESVKRKDSFRRCECAVNTDIGGYHRCKHDCLYCYAK